VKQTFLRFDASGIQAEDDARFQYFTTKVSFRSSLAVSNAVPPLLIPPHCAPPQTLPALLQSAVASSHTLIFVPSYFDFVRLNAHLKTIDDLSFAVLSE
jgi:U3 small nucleolar RNA-associated protein 25